MAFRKRGLSDVVTTLIIILLALVAITVIWIVVQNIISNSKGDIERSLNRADFEIVSVYNDTNQIYVNVDRLTGPGDVNEIAFVFEGGNFKETVFNYTNLKPLERSIFKFSFDSLNINSMDLISIVSIAPGYVDETGNRFIGNIVDSYYLSSGLIDSNNPDDSNPDNPSDPGDIDGGDQNGFEVLSIGLKLDNFLVNDNKIYFQCADEVSDKTYDVEFEVNQPEAFLNAVWYYSHNGYDFDILSSGNDCILESGFIFRFNTGLNNDGGGDIICKDSPLVSITDDPVQHQIYFGLNISYQTQTGINYYWYNSPVFTLSEGSCPLYVSDIKTTN